MLPHEAFTLLFPWPLCSLSREYLLGLMGCGGAAKVVKGDFEPLVDLGMDSVVLITDLLRCQPLLHGLCLCGSAVLISTAQVQRVPVAQTTVPGQDTRSEAGCLSLPARTKASHKPSVTSNGSELCGKAHALNADGPRLHFWYLQLKNTQAAGLGKASSSGLGGPLILRTEQKTRLHGPVVHLM